MENFKFVRLGILPRIGLAYLVTITYILNMDGLLTTLGIQANNSLFISIISGILIAISTYSIIGNLYFKTKK